MRLTTTRAIMIASLLLVAAATSEAVPDDAKRYLIIHADDAGMSHSVNVATVEALEKGVVTSASIMMPCPWVEEFAAYTRDHPEGDWGVHLTLNSEWKHYRWGPVASRSQVPSLVDENGYLWQSILEVATHAKADEVEIELRAQVERAQALGIPLSHLDTHMGALVSRPDLAEVYVRVGLAFDLPVLFLRPDNPLFETRFPHLVETAGLACQQLDAAGLPILDTLIMDVGKTGHEARKAGYLDLLRNLKPGVTQLIIHCGQEGPELEAISARWESRDSDRRVFTDPEIRAELDKLGIELTTWRALHQRTAGAKKAKKPL